MRTRTMRGWMSAFSTGVWLNVSYWKALKTMSMAACSRH